MVFRCFFLEFFSKTVLPRAGGVFFFRVSSVCFFCGRDLFSLEVFFEKKEGISSMGC